MDHPSEKKNVVSLSPSQNGGLGVHCLVDYWGCSFELLNDIDLIRKMFEDGLNSANATVIKIVMHQFSPQGVTGIASIAESHVSIHTWPELGYAAIDVFSCGTKMSIQKLLSHFETILSPSEIQMKQIDRGIQTKLSRSS